MRRARSGIEGKWMDDGTAWVNRYGMHVLLERAVPYRPKLSAALREWASS